MKITKRMLAGKIGKSQPVENSVESVEFHTENRLIEWTFSLFPRGFPHVENKKGCLQLVYRPNVENFWAGQNR
ncbi:hypothetical protein [Faecalibacterium gallinarum]|uniref:hypothetical protein n=1 Tax=Faecalibacterium gallinarum TaxID=2903556 RepID=UPI001EE2208C|nr:hypothetical protein [Faecalibacterium gallinarum]